MGILFRMIVVIVAVGLLMLRLVLGCGIRILLSLIIMTMILVRVVVWCCRVCSTMIVNVSRALIRVAVNAMRGVFVTVDYGARAAVARVKVSCFYGNLLRGTWLCRVLRRI